MSCNYIPIEYGRVDGTIVSERVFFEEHRDIELTPSQRTRMIQNLEVQCNLVYKKIANKKKIILKGFYQNFVFVDEVSSELYLKPLEIDVGVFIKYENERAILLIYDMRKIS